MKERLAREGLFEQDAKQPLPHYPGKIALITSPAGAAVRDMIRILRTRWPMAQVLVVPVRVQGEGAASEIAAAIHAVNNLAGVDLIITGRGGGSMEDLWAFNEEVVARAIFISNIPVISAVGHEPDVTIADYVADLRAATPLQRRRIGSAGPRGGAEAAPAAGTADGPRHIVPAGQPAPSAVPAAGRRGFCRA